MVNNCSGKSRELLIFNLAFIGGFLLKYNMLQIRVYHAPSVMLLLARNLLFLLVILVFLLPLMYHRRGRKILLVWYLVFTAFFFMNIWYNRYFGNYLSISDILMGRGMRPVRVIALQLLRPIDALFVLNAVLLCIVYMFSRRTIDLHVRPLVLGQYRKTWGLIILALLALQISGAHERFGHMSPAMLYRRSTPAFVSAYGIIPLYAMEYALLFHPQAFPSPLPQNDTVPPMENDLAGVEVVEQGQNIICIQVESLDSSIIGHTYGGRDIMPFLKSLKDQSLYFDNFYAQHTNGSFDAELSLLTSVYPINKNYGFKVNDLASFDSLPRVLRDAGYETVAFHGNDKEFFFRDKAYEELGFNRFYSREDYDESAMMFSNEGSTFGINDYDFFKQSAETLKTIEQPFFALLITVTSHTPYSFYPEKLSVEAFDDIQNPLVRGYFNSMTFVDRSLEMFFSRLADAGLLEDSLIIIYSDHDAAIDRPLYTSKREFVLDRQVKIPEHIPLLLIHPDIEPGISHKEGSPVDIGPTILDLLGEIEKPEEFLGYSLLSPIESPVFFLKELPQVIEQGQLLGIAPDGIVPIGYVADIGEKELDVSEDYYQMMLDYLRDVVFERRLEND